MYNTRPRNYVATIYKSSIRPQLDFWAIIFDQPENESFCKKIESLKYNATLLITGVMRGSSREKIYKELGLEILKSRKWLRRLCCFYKIQNNGSFFYIAELILSGSHLYNTQNTRNITAYSCRTDSLKFVFFYHGQ